MKGKSYKAVAKIKQCCIRLYYWDSSFFLLVAVAVTGLVFSVFFGQALFSDVVTFGKAHDALPLCYPQFLKLLDFPNFLGVDIGAANGATEFMLRPNLTTFYLPILPFAYLSKWLPARFCFILFFMFQLVLASFFSMLFAKRYFYFERHYAIIFMCSYLGICLYESWYTGFFIVSTLVFVTLYFAFHALSYERWYKYLLLYAFPYILLLTSGYVTLAAACVGFIVLATLIYGLFFIKTTNPIHICLRAIMPPLVAGGVCIMYYLEVFEYVATIVQPVATTIAAATGIPLNIKNLLYSISMAFTQHIAIEQMPVLTFGIVWLVLIVFLFINNSFQKFEKSDKCFLFFVLVVFAVLALCSLGAETPMAAWFFSFVPILGSMHLPIRYLMFVVPLVYLGLCKALQIECIKSGHGFFKTCARVFCAVIFALLFLGHFDITKFVNTDKLILELILAAVACFCIYQCGIKSVITLFVCCFSILTPFIQLFYAQNEVYVPNQVFEQKSIVFNEKGRNILNDFISTLPPKELYRFLAFDSLENIPTYVPNNYAWYNLSPYNLSNYTTYELHLGTPADYLKKFPWFSNPDWEYVVNTRGDFIVTDLATIEKDIEKLEKYIDFGAESYPLDDKGRRVFRLIKYVPSYYSGELHQRDTSDALDNGYFYCPYLRNENIKFFNTDNATFYEINISADRPVDLAFLLYPNRHYKYYVNDTVVNPIIDGMCAYIPIKQGIQKITIQYENPRLMMSNVIFLLYYVAVVVCVLSIMLCCLRTRQRKGKITKKFWQDDTGNNIE